MSIPERIATGVLLALWRARAALPIASLQRHTRAEMPLLLDAIESLRRRACLIERSPLGIELISVGLPCWGTLLEHELPPSASRLGRRVEVLDHAASTNDIAWQKAPDPQSDGLVVLADDQTAGRGRRGHAWHTKPGQSVLMSVLLHDIGPEMLDRLTLLAGLAAAEGIEHAAEEHPGNAAGIRVAIRWPNDLQIGPRKLGGILVEGRSLQNTRAAVVGIGINIAQAPGDFPPELSARAVSLFQAAGVLVDRVRVAARVLQALDHRLLQIRENIWMDDWKSRCSLLGRRITARVGERSVTGMVVDVDPLQGLVLRDDAGGTQLLSARTSSLAAL